MTTEVKVKVRIVEVPERLGQFLGCEGTVIQASPEKATVAFPGGTHWVFPWECLVVQA